MKEPFTLQAPKLEHFWSKKQAKPSKQERTAQVEQAEDDWLGEDFRAIPLDYETFEPVDDWADIEAPLVEDEVVYKLRAANMDKASLEQMHFETVEFRLKKDRENEEKSEDEKTVKMSQWNMFEQKKVHCNSNKSVHVDTKPEKSRENVSRPKKATRPKQPQPNQKPKKAPELAEIYNTKKRKFRINEKRKLKSEETEKQPRISGLADYNEEMGNIHRANEDILVSLIEGGAKPGKSNWENNWKCIRKKQKFFRKKWIYGKNRSGKNRSKNSCKNAFFREKTKFGSVHPKLPKNVNLRRIGIRIKSL